MTLLSFLAFMVGRRSVPALPVLVILLAAGDANAVILTPLVVEYTARSTGNLDCPPCTTLNAFEGVISPVMASSKVLAQGVPPQDWRARTAARASAREIAANALFEERALQQISLSGPSEALRSVADIVLIATMHSSVRSEVFLDFMLPPGFVEFRDNVETGPLNTGQTFPGGADGIGASISARISSCAPGAPNCVLGILDEQFQLSAELSGNYGGHALDATSAGSGRNAGLDTSALLANSVGVQQLPGGFERLYHWSHPAYSGRLSLGIFDPGDTVYVEYELVAELAGLGWGNYAAAAINDPFALDIDPVQATPFTLEAIAIPEPSVGALFVAVALVGWRRRMLAGRGPVI